MNYNPAYPSKQSPVVPNAVPNGFINLTVSADIWPPEPNSPYFDVYMCHYPNLWFAVAGFGDTEAEALQDFLLAYHDIQIDALKDGRPIPILRFRFVRHKRNNK